MTPLSLTLGYVPGGTPAKWARIWSERHPEVPLQLRAVAAADAAAAVRDGTVDVALLRLPADTSGLAVIPLYEETTVAVVPTDHLLTAVDAITAADLDGEPTLLPLDNVVAWADAPGDPVAAGTVVVSLVGRVGRRIAVDCVESPARGTAETRRRHSICDRWRCPSSSGQLLHADREKACNNWPFGVGLQNQLSRACSARSAFRRRSSRSTFW